MVLEGTLEGEMDDHLGYARRDPEGRNGGNSRNGRRAKTVLADTGPVEISVPRDRAASFEPQIVAKRQRRLTGIEDMVISLSAKGLTHGEIAAHPDAPMATRMVGAVCRHCAEDRRRRADGRRGGTLTASSGALLP
jgi:transposase-like protein